MFISFLREFKLRWLLTSYFKLIFFFFSHLIFDICVEIRLNLNSYIIKFISIFSFSDNEPETSRYLKPMNTDEEISNS